MSTLLAFAGAFLLVLAPRLRFWSGRFLAMSRHHNFVVALLVQLSAYAVFVAVSERIFSGSDSNLAWIGLWLAVALVTLLALLIALAPVRFWARLVSRELSGGSVAAVAAIAAWTIGQGAQQFWQPLAEWTFWLVEQLLAPFYDDLIMTSERRILGTGRFLVRIAPECSFDLLGEAALLDVANLVNYDALVLPYMAYAKASEVDRISETLQHAIYRYGIGIICGDNLLTNDETGAAFGGDAFLRMKQVLG
ncbi:MAG: hypothetical protein AAF458_22860, partial [Pseudomonadota bacterium]